MTLVYNTGLAFNSVFVIESLPSGELKTGQSLYENVLAPAVGQHPGLHARHFQVQSEADLLKTLRLISAECLQFGRGPLIHFDAHGNSDGLGLADGTLCAWRSITPLLAEINRGCRMNLLVLAMMCKGWDLTVHLMPSDRAPLFMLIGPPDSMSAGDILDATLRFYRELTTSWDLNAALSAMNSGADFSNWLIKPATAEILFCRVFRYYIEDLESGSHLQDRENLLVADMVRANNLTVVQSALLREQIRKDLRDYPAWYDRLREPFLMLDLFPDNRPRFGLTYDKCRPPAV